MIPKFRAWYGEEMYDEPVIYNGEFYLDWRDFIDGRTFDGAVLMQSTGLFDKNGKEIFERDVVIITDYDEFPRTVVRYVQGTYCLFEGDNCLEALADYYEDMEIIGNIHEHPHLVEVGHDQ